MDQNIVKIMSGNAPTPIGPFSHAVKVGNLVFITGQMPTDPKTNEMILGTFAEQTRLVLENLKIILDEVGSDPDHVIQSRVFITNMGHFEEVNQVYRSFFGRDLPARTCIGVTGLAGGADVEIDMIAWIPENQSK
ncbi:RidA family protein [Paenibacillus beijingensis]|uniref:Endoribonuclease L-PSP n=1 Tax=Paenibacillus beijingensis TaxID=1126833 RepID=A0A0D5NPD8_9BACL|nr:Rid family detoxifying hydrolase [Paenibacillus beijingensis]AJY76882.1 endoribonuclease L-PSP [Paenibacillus beijingensis]